MTEWFRVRAGELVRGQNPVLVYADDAVESAVETLIRARVSSVPVWVPEFTCHERCQIG